MSIAPDPRAVIPPSRQSANLTVLAAAAMAFLAVLSVAILLIGARLAQSWTAELAGTATLTVEAPEDPAAIERLATALAGIEGLTAEQIPPEAQAELLKPWLGETLAPGDLPLPAMFALSAAGEMPTGAITSAAAAESLTATLDTHDRWRDPLTAFARRAAWTGLGAALVVLGALVAIVTLASEAALATNLPVLRTLRLVGASDTFIARAFVRRFTLRALIGAVIGTVIGLVAAAILAATGALGPDATLTWRDAPYLVAIPLIAAITAFISTRIAAMRTLKKGL